MPRITKTVDREFGRPRNASMRPGRNAPDNFVDELFVIDVFTLQ